MVQPRTCATNVPSSDLESDRQIAHPDTDASLNGSGSTCSGQVKLATVL